MPVNTTIMCTLGVIVEMDTIAVPAASVSESFAAVINELKISVVNGRYLCTRHVRDETAYEIINNCTTY